MTATSQLVIFQASLRFCRKAGDDQEKKEAKDVLMVQPVAEYSGKNRCSRLGRRIWGSTYAPHTPLKSNSSMKKHQDQNYMTAWPQKIWWQGVRVTDAEL